MRKLLRPKDILLLTLAGSLDFVEEVNDPLHLVSNAYKTMYGFTPSRYKKHNFMQTMGRSLKTGDIEKVEKNGQVYLRLTSNGEKRIKRDFPITQLTKKWNRKWVTLIFDIEEKSRVVRDRLRPKLTSIGFGMLQESVWITPLPLGVDVWEFIETVGLKDNVFVLEVSNLLGGSAKELANKIWNLYELEEKYIELKMEIKKINQLIESYNDRGDKREADLSLSNSIYQNHIYKLKIKKRELMRKKLEFVLSLPPLPQELLPNNLKDATLHKIISS